MTLHLIAMILLVCAMVFLPLSARADTGTGSLSGTVTDTSGNAIGGATVSLSGPATASTMTGKDGTFQFAALPAGAYHVSVSKTGYADASRSDIAIAGPNTAISVLLVSVNVRQLGRIVVLAKASTINTTPASVYQVTVQSFKDQGQIQLRPILEQIPGVSVEIRNGDAFNNGGGIMALGNDTLITIRGAFSYETATLVDGHNLFGGIDGIGFNSAMLNSIGLQRLDTVKGPGASSPTINDAIGGSLNYITLDPTGTPQGSISEATDGYGGSVFNFNYTGTMSNGKLGYALAHAAQATPGGLNHHTNFFTSLSGKVNGQSQGFCFGNTGPSCSVFLTSADPGLFLGTSPIQTYGFNLVFCCDTEATLGKQFNDFAKLRYHFSPTTSFAVTHMSETTDNDFGGFQGLQLGGGFVPFPGFTGPGIGLVDAFQPGEFTGSHLFQSLNELDLQTGILHGNLRLSYAGFYQFSYYFEQAFKTPPTFLAYGAVPTGNPGNPFIFANGMPVTLASNNDFTIVGFTTLKDYLVEYDLPIKSSLFTVSYDKTSYTPDVGQRCCGPGFFFDNYNAIYNRHLTGITDQVLLRATFDPIRNLTATTSLYLNRYNEHTADSPIFPAFTGPPNCNANPPAGQQPCYGLNGGNLTAPLSLAYFNSYHDHYTFYDAPRIGLTWRPTNDVSWRLAIGGAIAPVNLEDSNSRAGSAPPSAVGSPPTYYTVFKSDPNLHPETAFGYDLGVDRRLPGRDMLFSGDLYLTNLFGLFNTVTQPAGTFNGLPLLATIRTNIASSRYEGVELAVRKSPPLGLSWQINGALMRAYAYNLPPHFYDIVQSVDKSGNITWMPLQTNLAVIPGKNFNDGYFNGGPGNGTEASPYSEGYAEVSYRTTHNGLLLFGANYYGPNNDYFRPGFFVLTASARREIFPNWTVELAAHNLGDLYNGLLQASYFQTKDGFGVPVALINKTSGLAPGGVIGPRTLSVTLTRTF